MYYLCTMKNETEIKTILLDKGYIEGENPNEYIKDIWTIRLDSEYIEVFNIPREDEIFPLYARVNNEKINDVLEDIDRLSNL